MSTTKKATIAKPVEKEVFNAKTKFAGRKIGANLAIVYGGDDGKRFAKKVNMEEGAEILAKIEKFNKRPSQTQYNDIVKAMTPEATKVKQEKEIAEAKQKGLKQQIKKVVKKSTDKEEVKEAKSVLQQLEDLLKNDTTGETKTGLQELISKFSKKEEKAPIPQETPKPWGGENYRRY